MLKHTLQFLLLFAALATPYAIIAYANDAKLKRNCSVSTFPVQVFSGNECRYGWVQTGYDIDANKIACAQIQVNCR